LPSHAPGPSLPERIRSLPLDTVTREALAELAERAEHAAEFERMLARARAGLPAVLPVAPRRHRRDRHGLHIVPGVVVAAFMWALRSRVPKIAGAALAVVMGGTVLAPAVLPAGHASAGRQPAPTPPASVRHHRPGQLPLPVAAAMPQRPKRSADDDDVTDVDSAVPAPTATPTPVPSPSPTHGHRHPRPSRG
jgi:hypothetical protein